MRVFCVRHGGGLRGALLPVCLLIGICTMGTTCDPGGIFPPEGLNITATPTGCGVKTSNTETISWSVTFTASGADDPNASYEWFFSDGAGASGQIVVHSFNTAALESGATGSHVPVNFDVTLVSAGESVTETFGIPMRGTPDGGPEPAGDVCEFDDGRRHVPEGTELCYTTNPPVSGPHYSGVGLAPVQPGLYLEDEAVLTEKWVHNLEHGGIVLLYDCGGPCSDDLLAALQDLFDAVPISPRFDEPKMVITPYTGLRPACTGTPTFPDSGPYLAIGWGVQRSFATLDTDGIIDFYLRHVDHGPEDAPIAPGIHEH